MCIHINMCESDRVVVYLEYRATADDFILYYLTLLLLWVVYEKTTVIERDQISHGTGSVCRS